MSFVRVTFAAFAFAIGCTTRAAAPTVVAVAPLASSSPPPLVVATPEPEEDFGCGVFAKDGVSPSASELRKCVAREARQDACGEHASPTLPKLELAVAMIDGVGGPRDVEGARALLAPCFADVAVEDVLEHASKVASNPKTAPLDSCSDYASTTFASLECIVEHTKNERAWLAQARRDWDPATRALFDAATRAHDEFAEKVGTVFYAMYAGGTMRDPAMRSRVLALLRVRRARIAKFRANDAAPSKNDVSAAAAKRALDAALAQLRVDAPSNVIDALADVQPAWQRYRDAETALYEAAHPGSRAALTVTLERELAGALTTQ